MNSNIMKWLLTVNTGVWTWSQTSSIIQWLCKFGYCI